MPDSILNYAPVATDKRARLQFALGRYGWRLAVLAIIVLGYVFRAKIPLEKVTTQDEMTCKVCGLMREVEVRKLAGITYSKTEKNDTAYSAFYKRHVDLAHEHRWAFDLHMSIGGKIFGPKDLLELWNRGESIGCNSREVLPWLDSKFSDQPIEVKRKIFAEMMGTPEYSALFYTLRRFEQEFQR